METDAGLHDVVIIGDFELRKLLIFMVTPGRFELPTRSLGNCCSIHLSYGAIEAVSSELPQVPAEIKFSRSKLRDYGEGTLTPTHLRDSLPFFDGLAPRL